MKISIASLRKLLPVGKIFTAEFVMTGEKTKRKVLKQSTYEMITEYLGGEKDGKEIYCSWTGVKADEQGGWITLSDDFSAFVRFKIDE